MSPRFYRFIFLYNNEISVSKRFFSDISNVNILFSSFSSGYICQLLYRVNLLFELMNLFLMLFIQFLRFQLCLLSLFHLFLGFGLRFNKLLFVHISGLLCSNVDNLISATTERITANRLCDRASFINCLYNRL